MSSYTNYTDLELADLLAAGDDNAFSEIYKRYWPILFRHARKMLHDDDEATDVVQEVFTTLWSKASELSLDRSVSAYLYSAVRNKIIDLINREKVKKNYTNSLQEFIDRGEFITDNTILERELSRQIENEIAMLPPKMRQIFELSRKSNLSYRAIAEEVFISEGTVKKQIYNALKILRTKLGSFFFQLF